ncbi:hypothetical protein [Pseudonocardia acidicola]|uniref:Uncharacterized protein n=1 Tax=Pseudonocardia acidicola TaxID=2724939 RepID=A0ABX1SLA3_9PSEU|nr:hypothetical protein [Pseudonocardia acidicola]NMI00919.1 hypothetical protein [Pseudonocardia acidicola]
MLTAQIGGIEMGIAINVADGPLTAASELLQWNSLRVSVVNLILIGLVTVIVAVALTPVEASAYRFGRSGQPPTRSPAGRAERGGAAL